MTAKKADSFGFAPPKRWTGLVRETSSDRWVQYPRLVPDKWRGNFQGERDAPMSGGLESSRICIPVKKDKYLQIQIMRQPVFRSSCRKKQRLTVSTLPRA